MNRFVTRYAKGTVAFVVSVVLGAIAQGLINGAAAAWATLVIGGLTTAGVVAKANTNPDDVEAGVADWGALIIAVVFFILGGLCAKNGLIF